MKCLLGSCAEQQPWRLCQQDTRCSRWFQAAGRCPLLNATCAGTNLGCWGSPSSQMQSSPQPCRWEGVARVPPALFQAKWAPLAPIELLRGRPLGAIASPGAAARREQCHCQPAQLVPKCTSTTFLQLPTRARAQSRFGTALPASRREPRIAPPCHASALPNHGFVHFLCN